MKELKYQGIISDIAPSDEKQAILEYLNRYWDVKVEGKFGLPEVIDYIFDKGVKDGILYRETEVEPLIDSYNILARLYSGEPDAKRKKIEFTRTSKSSKRRFNFEHKMNSLEERLSQNVQISAKPKGYDEYCAAHTEEFPEADEKPEFKGAELHYSIGACSFGFGESLSKAQVKYDDKSQCRSPLKTMIGTIFRQGFNLGVLVVEQKYRPQLNLK